MSDKLKRGTRVRVTSTARVGDRGTVVKVREDDTYLVYIDDEEDTYGFFRSELEVHVEPVVKRVNSPSDLLDLKAALGVRDDWHEPDNQDVTAWVSGRSFDNAGFWGDDYLQHARSRDSEDSVELYVTLFKDGDPVAEVNLASLFAWATGYEG